MEKDGVLRDSGEEKKEEKEEEKERENICIY